MTETCPHCHDYLVRDCTNGLLYCITDECPIDCLSYADLQRIKDEESDRVDGFKVLPVLKDEGD